MKLYNITIKNIISNYTSDVVANRGECTFDLNDIVLFSNTTFGFRVFLKSGLILSLDQKPYEDLVKEFNNSRS